MLEWMDQYGADVGSDGGRIMGWYRGPNPALWVTSPEILKVILKGMFRNASFSSQESYKNKYYANMGIQNYPSVKFPNCRKYL